MSIPVAKKKEGRKRERMMKGKTSLSVTLSVPQ